MHWNNGIKENNGKERRCQIEMGRGGESRERVHKGILRMD